MSGEDVKVYPPTAEATGTAYPAEAVRKRLEKKTVVLEVTEPASLPEDDLPDWPGA